MTNPLFKKTYKHILDEDVIAASQDRRPSYARDMRIAKLVLQECSDETGDCMYDHLSEVIRKIIDERPPNVIDYFEDYSRQIREERFRMNENLFHNTYIEPERLISAQKNLKSLKIPPPTDYPGEQLTGPVTGEEEERKEPFIADVMHLQFYWSLIGFGFPQSKVFYLSCAMRELEALPIVQKVRFWGEIFGIDRNYTIVEADLTEEEIEIRSLAEKKILDDKQEKESLEALALEVSFKIVPDNLLMKPPPFPELEDDLPHPMRDKWPPKCPPLPYAYERKKEIPDETIGTGLNRKTYFVCNHIGEDWTELPPVTIKQIVVSRQIRKLMTGHLHAEINSYPSFPGYEKNYLRAIIARITASCYVAPVGQYRQGNADDEEEEETPEEDEEINNDKETFLDPDYDPMNLTDMLSANNWVHIRPNILKQGRVVWFNPKDLEEAANDEEEAEEEEDENIDPKYQPEFGPNLLSKCDEDAFEQLQSVWSIRLNHTYNHHNPVVVARSNLWPGAVAFSSQRTHDCLYTGWGTKYVARNYSPIPIPPIESDYPLGPEIMEMADPTVEQEDEWAAKYAKKDIEGEGEEFGIEEDDDNVEDGDDDE